MEGEGGMKGYTYTQSKSNQISSLWVSTVARDGVMCTDSHQQLKEDLYMYMDR